MVRHISLTEVGVILPEADMPTSMGMPWVISNDKWKEGTVTINGQEDNRLMLKEKGKANVTVLLHERLKRAECY